MKEGTDKKFLQTILEFHQLDCASAERRFIHIPNANVLC